jgi:uncharacterized protein YegL
MPSGKYVQPASRANPACIIFLLDQSYSMNNGIAGSPRPKIEALATGINRFIADLITLCEKGEEKPRNYFDVGVVGYTTDRSDPPNPIVGPVLTGERGTLAGRDLVSVSDLFDDPLAIEERQKMVDDGAGGLISTTFKMPVWYRKPPDASMSGTAMCTALDYVRNIAATWCASHPNSFPPVVIHLTDGEPTDGDPVPFADALKALSTADGELLLFNCHISESQANPVVFPNSEHILADDLAKALFRMSSELPDKLRGVAESKGVLCGTGARGMVFNADGAQMLLLIQMGTVGAQQAAPTESAAPTSPLHY